MAFIGYNKLKKILEENIESYNPEMFEGSSYGLTLGDEAYVTNSKNGKKEILDDKNKSVEIEPGQFALLLTKEKVTVPKDTIAFINLKFSVKAMGLINNSGFHVDSGFSGKLVFWVYNAGTRTFILEKGKQYFSIWFSELIGDSNDESTAYNGKHQHQDTIPTQYIEVLKGELASPNILLNRLKDAESLKKNQTYVLGIIAVALLGICINLFWSDSKYKKGYMDGISDKQATERIEKIIKEKNIDSLLIDKGKSLFILKGDSIK